MSIFQKTRRASAVASCAPAVLYEVLTDYEGYAEWLPLVVSSQTLAREGDLAIAEFGLAGRAREKFVFECIHTRNRMVLWRTIGGRIPISQVEWSLKDIGQERTEVSLAVRGLAPWTQPFSEMKDFLNPGRTLSALQNQATTYLPEFAVEGENGELLLELSDTGDDLVCWVRGRRYVLKPEAEESHD